jgi:endonuclease/exonuclease/phosphatase family metal-dependent hydrolase
MKLISLNLWGGRVFEPLAEFVRKYSDVDIFCFQEIYNNAKESMSDEPREHRPNLLADLKELLPDHKAYFRPIIEHVYGIGIFVKGGVLEEGEIKIFNSPNYPRQGGAHSRNLQWIQIKADEKTYLIMNVHGLHTGTGKGDTTDRLKQSQAILDFMSTRDGIRILCGDFNLLPETESLIMLEKGMINLVKKYEVQSTRSFYYQKEIKFADYVIVSPDVKVKTFEVLQEPVSDHLPLLLEF